MTAHRTTNGLTLGFLTIVEDDQHGAFGGLLVLNATGRPLEFHCTTPVKANRAQEILYGPTLRPYLHGELIGGALTAKAASPPGLLCVDRAELLAVRPQVEAPVVLVADDDSDTPTGQPDSLRVDPPQGIAAPQWFQLGPYRLAAHAAFADDREAAMARLAPLADFDLREPFGRIREAIEEAQRGHR